MAGAASSPSSQANARPVTADSTGGPNTGGNPSGVVTAPIGPGGPPGPPPPPPQPPSAPTGGTGTGPTSTPTPPPTPNTPLALPGTFALPGGPGSVPFQTPDFSVNRVQGQGPVTFGPGIAGAGGSPVPTSDADLVALIAKLAGRFGGAGQG